MINRTINLREKNHPLCLKCAPEERDKNLEDGVCTKIVSVDDNLSVRCVGAWSYEKIYRLTQYLGIFAPGMKNKWEKLNYIEICSGPGRCIERETGTEEDGTALAILNHSSHKHINKSLFIDNDDKVVDALNKRIEKLNKTCSAKAVKCDYNDLEKIQTILYELPTNSLNLVLIDPTDCGISFLLIEKINDTLKNTDFIINVAYGTDLIRNLRNAIRKPSYIVAKEKYHNFLGSHDFFSRDEIKEAARIQSDDSLLRLFLKEYEKNLSNLGFIHVDYEPVKNFYYLLFATKNKTGLEFWKKANQIEPNGQRTLLL